MKSLKDQKQKKRQQRAAALKQIKPNTKPLKVDKRKI